MANRGRVATPRHGVGGRESPPNPNSEVTLRTTQAATLGILGLMLAAAVPVDVGRPSKNQGRSQLHCHLTAERPSDVADGTFPGVLGLRNDSNVPITIEFQDDPTDHLSLEIRDPADRLVPTAFPSYGGIYAKIHTDEDRETLTIKPGETYRQDLALFAQTDRQAHPLAPGKYTIVAVYRWRGSELRSSQVTVQVRAK